MFLCTSPLEYLERPDESCLCQGTSPSVCRRHEEQASTRSFWAWKTGQAGKGCTSATNYPARAPYWLHSVLAVSHPRILNLTHPQESPFQFKPRLPAALGSHHRLWEEEPPRRESDDSLSLQRWCQVPDLLQCFKATSASWKAADWLMVRKPGHRGITGGWLQCPFKGTQLGGWDPRTRVQGHMIADSDGEACDRVYH